MKKCNRKMSLVRPYWLIYYKAQAVFEQQFNVDYNRCVFPLDHLLLLKCRLIPFVDKRKKLTASDGGI